MPIIGFIANNTVSLKFNNLGTNGTVKMYNIAALTKMIRNGQVLVVGANEWDSMSTRWKPPVGILYVPIGTVRLSP